MGGVTDFLFGSTDEGGYKGEAPTMTPGQKALLDQLTTLLGGQAGKGVAPYQGQMVAGPSNLQTQGFNLIDQLLSGGGAYGNAQDAINRIMNQPTTGQPFDPAAATNFWEKSIKAPALQTWKEDILPTVKESFIGQNAGRSGAANRAIARSGEDLASNLQASLSDILFQGSEAQKNRALTQEQNQLGRLLNIPGLATSTAITPIQTALNAGQIQRGITGEQLQAPFQQWQMQQPYNNPWLNLLPTLFGSRAFEPIVQGPSSQSGLVQDVLAPIMSAWAGSGSGSQTISGWFG